MRFRTKMWVFTGLLLSFYPEGYPFNEGFTFLSFLIFSVYDIFKTLNKELNDWVNKK